MGIKWLRVASGVVVALSCSLLLFITISHLLDFVSTQ